MMARAPSSRLCRQGLTNQGARLGKAVPEIGRRAVLYQCQTKQPPENACKGQGSCSVQYSTRQAWTVRRLRASPMRFHGWGIELSAGIARPSSSPNTHASARKPDPSSASMFSRRAASLRNCSSSDTGLPARCPARCPAECPFVCCCCAAADGVPGWDPGLCDAWGCPGRMLSERAAQLLQGWSRQGSAPQAGSHRM